MLSLVVAGGLLIAMSFIFGINAFEEKGSLAAVLMETGKAAFGLMVPILAGYIAYSIADRPGLAPGLIGGALAVQLQSGFLGGIVAGFLAGYLALLLVKHIKLPVTMEALKPILIVPLISSLAVGLIMFYIVGEPVAQLFAAMNNFLTSMGTANAVLLGVIIGAMMCVDLGGPINKAAYTFSVGLLTTQNYFPMAAAMAGGMVPAIGIAIATMLAKRKFSESEVSAGKASFVLGLCFISEGAIPFAARDPMRVIPCCIAGGALTGAL
ncbi:PTS fructose transporter subunit IIC, partial [Neisseria dentiae]